jgi:hypothetical protein
MLAVTAAAGVAVVGAALPWARNPLAPDRDGWTVLTAAGASVPVTLLLFVAVAAAVAVAGAAMGGVVAGRWAARVAMFAAATGLVCLSWYGVRIATDRVRAIGVDLATGEMIEPEAVTRLGVGWYIAVVAVLAMALIGHVDRGSFATVSRSGREPHGRRAPC